MAGHSAGSSADRGPAAGLVTIDRPPAGRADRPGTRDLCRPPSPVPPGLRCRGRPPAGRCPDAVDDPLGGVLPAVRRVGLRRAADRRRRRGVRRPLPGRHRRDDRSCPPCRGGRDRQQGGRRNHHHAAVGRRHLGPRRAQPPLRAPPVAVRDDGDRRQPVRAPLRPAPDRPTADRGDGVVLSRHRRRDLRDAGRRPRRAAARPTRAPGRRGPDHRRRAVQRRRSPSTGVSPRATSPACSWSRL